MKRMNRRSFMLVSSVGAASTLLVACGNDPDDEDLNPTIIPVEGAPPTLAPVATPGGGASDSEETPDAGGDAADGAVTLEAQDPYAWSNDNLEASPGQTIQITNVGVLEHNFTIDELDIAQDLPPGEEQDVTLPDDLAVGDIYTYYCSVPGHREGGMEGTLTIVDATAPDEAATGAGDAGGQLHLEAMDPYAWSTHELEAAPGQMIEIVNVGVLEHNFTIDELDIAQDLPPGEPQEVTLPDDLAVGDTYEFYCSVPGHREGGMEGVLTIIDGSAAAPAREDSTAEEEATSEEVTTVVAGGSADGPVTLEAQDPYAWSIYELEAAPGQTIEITNVGVLEHNFVIDELDIAQDLPPGEPQDVALPDDLAVGDTYEFYCSVPGHREGGMEGVLTIIDGPAGEDSDNAGEEATSEEVTTVVASPAAATPDATVEIGTEFTIVASELFFDPNLIAAPAGSDVTVTLTNEGALPHDFVIDDLGISSDLIGPGETTEFSFNAAPGTYEFYCSEVGHAEAGMVGTLTVVDEGVAVVAGGESATPGASPVAIPMASPEAAGAEAAAEIEVSMLELLFDPSEIEGPAGSDITVKLVNQGALPHDFVIDELDIASDLLQAGETSTITINAAAGTYEFYCSEVGHAEAGMVGTLTLA